MIRADCRNDRFGFLRLPPDAHTLGISMAARMVETCGFRVYHADESLVHAAGDPQLPSNGRRLLSWIRGNGITIIGISWRLDPERGALMTDVFMRFLKSAGLRTAEGGSVRGVFFAGLPETCDLISARHPDMTGFFRGEEESGEFLDVMGIPRELYPAGMSENLSYDEARLAFGRDLVRKSDFGDILPVDRSGSRLFGKRGDSLQSRLEHASGRGLPPLIRAHAGPWFPDRAIALGEFGRWCGTLSKAGLLDILSVGTSQLSQSRFGEDWGDAANGGGVPVNSALEYSAIWEAARPMLVRTYSGAGCAERLVPVYESSIDIAWHALSFWWFSKLDGRGPLSMRDNLEDHFRALAAIAATGKPFEPNVPHHFAFRGVDDVGYVVSGYLAARAAKKAGIRLLVLQIMLETPRWTWGVQDLAKARALLFMARTLEGPGFRVILQPRAGLDYFSRDPAKAKSQLAASTALMDDIEPGDDTSPGIIHVVGYSEATGLADPAVINDSIRITRKALVEWRRSRVRDEIPDMGSDVETWERTRELLAQAGELVAGMEKAIPYLYSPAGFEAAFSAGYFPLPWLAAERDRYPKAAAGQTAFLDGGMRAIDESGKKLGIADRLARAELALKTGTRG